MKLCEILLMSIILVLGIVVIVTDFHAGVIKNKVLLVDIVFGVIINSIYITFFAKNFLCDNVANAACTGKFRICSVCVGKKRSAYRLLFGQNTLRKKRLQPPSHGKHNQNNDSALRNRKRKPRRNGNRR